MSLYEFQVVLGDITTMTDDVADALYEAGCDDGTPFSSSGVAYVGFSREAESLEEAVRSAVASIHKAGFSAARVEPADDAVYVRINQELGKH